MIVWICTDMEGLAGIDDWDQHADPDDNSPKYLDGRKQLTAEANAAIAGCFDGGATEVRILDGHGRNQNRGFVLEELDPRVKRTWVANRNPLRWEGLDETVDALAIIGQHAMAGTVGAYTDHTQCTKIICRYMFNGVEGGELSQMTMYAGAYGVPLVYASGDESLCAEARRLFPHIGGTTPTKRGLCWERCELYPPDEVRQNIRRDIAAAIKTADRKNAWRLETPVRVSIEYAWTGLADGPATIPGVRRLHARTVEWRIADQRDVYMVPSQGWEPLQGAW
jgi:D-amino peptidase